MHVRKGTQDDHFDHHRLFLCLDRRQHRLLVRAQQDAQPLSRDEMFACMLCNWIVFTIHCHVQRKLAEKSCERHSSDGEYISLMMHGNVTADLNT